MRKLANRAHYTRRMNAQTAPGRSLSPEAHWVEGELVRSLMRTQRDTQWVGLVVLAVFVGVLYDDIPPIWLAAWVL